MLYIILKRFDYRDMGRDIGRDIGKVKIEIGNGGEGEVVEKG